MRTKKFDFFFKVRNWIWLVFWLVLRSLNQHSSRSQHAPICRHRGCIVVTSSYFSLQVRQVLTLVWLSLFVVSNYNWLRFLWMEVKWQLLLLCQPQGLGKCCLFYLPQDWWPSVKVWRRLPIEMPLVIGIGHLNNNHALSFTKLQRVWFT